MVDTVHVAVRNSLFQNTYYPVSEGMADYVRSQAPRKVSVSLLHPDTKLSALARLSAADGLIVTLRDPAQCAALRRLGRPVVNLLDHRVETGLPTVCPDDRAVGDLAARHLMACGFRDLFYIGTAEAWSVEREKGFIARAASAGVRVITAPQLLGRTTRLTYPKSLKPMIQRIVARLPARGGIMTQNDDMAIQLIEIAVASGRRIPDDLAIIGTDNVAVVCESAMVPVSSIPLDLRRIGREAMALLDRQMQRKPVGQKMVLIPPLDVVCRRSTDAIVYPDPDVTQAIRIIRDNAAEGVSVGAIQRQLAISRSRLCWLFQKHVGHTPTEEIQRVRLEIAKRLLLETDLTPTEIAQKSGYCSQSHLTLHFRKAFGEPPRRFRVQQAGN